MGKIYHTFTLVSGDGMPLHGHYWKPEGKPRACILLVHGIGEHGARYNDWARRFVKLGFFVYALDYRGHGKAQGPRGFVHSLTELMDDVSMLVRRCERNFEDVPWFLYGLSSTPLARDSSMASSWAWKSRLNTVVPSWSTVTK